MLKLPPDPFPSPKFGDSSVPFWALASAALRWSEMQESEGAD